MGHLVKSLSQSVLSVRQTATVAHHKYQFPPARVKRKPTPLSKNLLRSESSGSDRIELIHPTLQPAVYNAHATFVPSYTGLGAQAYFGPSIEPLPARSVHHTSPLNDVHFADMNSMATFGVQVFNPGSTTSEGLDESAVSILMDCWYLSHQLRTCLRALQLGDLDRS